MDLQPLVLNPPLSVTLINSEEKLQELETFLGDNPVWGWDIETTPVKDYFCRRVRLMQFGTRDKQYDLDLLPFCDGDDDLLYRCQGNYGKNLHLAPRLKAVLERIRPFLESNKHLKVGVNLGFEYTAHYWNFGLRPYHFYSCDMVDRVIWAGAHSLKDYAFFSMDAMFARYFGCSIPNPELQTSFTLDGELSQAQLEYAALDTRIPLAIRAKQYQNKTNAEGKPIGGGALVQDRLIKTAQIENDAIGAFMDMHIHGERIDLEKWNARVLKDEEALKVALREMDVQFFAAGVPRKTDIPTEEQFINATAAWKAYRDQRQEEKIALKKELRKTGGVLSDEFDQQTKWVLEKMKADASTFRKGRTAALKLVEKCEGEALINYGSSAQMLAVLNGIKGLKALKATDDDELVKFKHIPIIAAIRTYRELSKKILTYGYTWSRQWVTKPCSDEGWLHPGDGRLHCEYNQLDAGTGRSTSSKPNGQNLPQDKEVRSCFIVDPPDEEEPDGYVMVTADMSGAELRIIAELANATSWIEAFARDEDVHSVGTEILYPDTWPKLALLEGGVVVKDGVEKKIKPCAYFQKHTADTVAKNVLCTLGDPQRQKCDCPEHKELRDGNKSTNFLLAYGGGPHTLAERLGVALEKAQALMELHESKFPDIWKYLKDSGEAAFKNKESRDMFDRRRIFPEPTWPNATIKAKEDREEKLRLPEKEAEQNVANFIAKNERKPKGGKKDIDGELFMLTHRPPNSKEIANALKAMSATIERQGKNHAIQGSNASIAKLAMGCGYDEKEGKPYLFHILPQYKAKLLKFVHDELVVLCPKRFGDIVAREIGDAFRRAGAERMTKVVMKFDFKIAACWQK